MNSKVKGQRLPKEALLTQREKRREKEAQLFKLQQEASAHTPLARSKPHDQPPRL